MNFRLVAQSVASIAFALLPCAVAPPAFAQAAAPASVAGADGEPAGDEGEDIVVQATRSGRRVQDEPVRVEVINREEIEEKVLMRPGNIAMILSETGGLRVQTTSPALGAANIRVQGLEGRYTQLLADGLPLYGGQASSLGLLQIPPTDLGQVEVIKGAASALYGPSALGGVINLVSRRPRGHAELELLANVTSRGGQDLTGYAATPLSDEWSASLTGGLHHQRRNDLDVDGWIDMPGYERRTVRPRAFWNGASGAKIFVTLGALREERVGGTLPGRTVPDGSPFPQTQDTRRLDAGLTGEVPLSDGVTAHVRSSAMAQKHTHTFGAVIEDDRHATLFGEASLAGKAGGTSWVGGLAYQVDSFRSQTFPAFDYTYRVPGMFAQVEQELGNKVTLAGSARVDDHSEYGTRFSPRLSLLVRPGSWTIRASAGRGFYAPTPFVEEIEDAGLSRLEPLAGLKPETATTASLDVGYASGPLEANLTLFGSNLKDTAEVAPTAADRARLVSEPGTTRVRGAEALLRYRWKSYIVTGSYVFVDASELGALGREALPLTPRHTAGVVAMWEQHDRGRVGLEVYYTGRQRLDDDPFRTTSRPYFEVGLLGEMAVGKARLFVNAENLLGVRQTKYNPIVRPARTPDGRWTVDVWGPTEGFTVNGGIRLRFSGDD